MYNTFYSVHAQKYIPSFTLPIVAILNFISLDFKNENINSALQEIHHKIRHF